MDLTADKGALASFNFHAGIFVLICERVSSHSEHNAPRLPGHFAIICLNVQDMRHETSMLRTPQQFHNVASCVGLQQHIPWLAGPCNGFAFQKSCLDGARFQGACDSHSLTGGQVSMVPGRCPLRSTTALWLKVY